jgi:hypothetical protein
MTEEEWLTCLDPPAMLEAIQGKVSARKLRLFACACARHVVDLMTEKASRRAVQIAEGYADDLISREARSSASARAEAIRAALQDQYDRDYSDAYAAGNQVIAAGYRCLAGVEAAAAARATLVGAAFRAATLASQSTCYADEFVVQADLWAAGKGRGGDFQLRNRVQQADLARCIFGSLYCPRRAVRPSSLRWNGGVLGKLAQGIYEDRAFDRLPILADALEEAGCMEPRILAHCRGAIVHSRGCWVLDLLLRKR